MLKPSIRTALAAASSAALVAPVALLSACAPNESPSSAPGTTPPVWTGSAAPQTAPPEAGPVAPESLTTNLKAPDGTTVATATFEFDKGSNGGSDKGYVTVTVQTVGVGQLSPGFHGLHVHRVGKCEPNSVAPAGGPAGNFLSAGGHYQAPGHTGDPESGDLTSLQVRQDGAGLLVTTTDGFTKEELFAGDGTSIIIHAAADNFSNIPAERYTQVNGTPGPDETTMSTGDAGKRVACGVIGAG
ncbi:superoxide dismutase family protein [Mycobacterium sp.]|uniref:superoxide dismutase[Cu-Zn] n=1 Tax=Mycobacterium sp. TaxID=1785 RepID=UPI0031DBC567